MKQPSTGPHHCTGVTRDVVATVDFWFRVLGLRFVGIVGIVDPRPRPRPCPQPAAKAAGTRTRKPAAATKAAA